MPETDGAGPRKRGRPPKPIDRTALVDAVERLFAEGGLEAVSIERTAQELSVSRATLYRTVPSKEDLLGLLFEGMTHDLDRAARRVAERDGRTPMERLEALVRVQVDAAVQMRDYLFVFWGGSWLPGDVYENWRRWRHDYEQIWRETIADAIAAGQLRAEDPAVATRLILGMTIWVSRWYRPEEGLTSDQIANHAIRLLNQDFIEP